MSEGELAQRFIASQASIKGDDLRKGRVPQSRWGKILAGLGAARASRSCSSTTRRTSSVLDVRAKAAGSPSRTRTGSG